MTSPASGAAGVIRSPQSETGRVAAPGATQDRLGALADRCWVALLVVVVVARLMVVLDSTTWYSTSKLA